MKNILKLTRRFVGVLLLSSILVFILNLAVLATLTSKYAQNGHPWETAEKAAENIRKTENGYVLSDEIMKLLEQEQAWAVYIDNRTLQVVWKTDSLPESVPLSYSASSIANLTQGYIDDYPTFTWGSENGLMVLGYPKDSFWKLMWPSWDYNFIAGFPKILLCVLVVNITLFFFIYMVANSRLLKSVRPITNGIQSLPTGKPVHVKEKGLLSELAASINRTSEILQEQKMQIRKKETARANWIAGVSHDIRTPLSMVMGYADQLKEDASLTEEERRKASVIVKQSERMKNLINDLNLSSKLEYNMQPIHSSKENLVSIARTVVVDFINMDIDDGHPIEWETDESISVCMINADKDLIKRAISNLIQNSINHNENGCHIFVKVTKSDNACSVAVSDDGVGVTDDELKQLESAPHYMLCDENTTEQRHGLGLLIVKQIALSHGGQTIISRGSHGGFSVELRLPLSGFH